MTAESRPSTQHCRLVVLISGSGSNLQAFIDASRDPAYPCSIVAVLSNRDGAGGLERARAAGIPAETLEHTRFASREEFDAELVRRIDRHAPDLVILAGFMRILGAGFVRRYAGRLMNIHPSLLPLYPGLHTHQRAIADPALQDQGGPGTENTLHGDHGGPGGGGPHPGAPPKGRHGVEGRFPGGFYPAPP